MKLKTRLYEVFFEYKSVCDVQDRRARPNSRELGARVLEYQLAEVEFKTEPVPYQKHSQRASWSISLYHPWPTTTPPQK